MSALVCFVFLEGSRICCQSHGPGPTRACPLIRSLSGRLLGRSSEIRVISALQRRQKAKRSNVALRTLGGGPGPGRG
eukprot:1485382-Alexandrium_andersonii.AAC.1